LDKGLNVDVLATGKGKTTLRLKWVLVNKVVAHQFSKQGISLSRCETQASNGLKSPTAFNKRGIGTYRIDAADDDQRFL
jgi:hypothetical protein